MASLEIDLKTCYHAAMAAVSACEKASGEVTDKILYHAAKTAAAACERSLSEIATIKATRKAAPAPAAEAAPAPAAETPKVEKPPKAPKAPKAEAAPAPAPAAQAPAAAPAPGNGVKVLAGFTITPPEKGSRMALPSKEELSKKALGLGMPQAEIDKFFPSGAKPTNELKLKLMEQLDGMMKAQPAAPTA